MAPGLTPQQIGKKIKKLRKQKDFSQEDIARILSIPRSSVAQVELGNRHISLIELVNLSDFLEFSLDQFLANDYEVSTELLTVSEPDVQTVETRISEPKLLARKFEAVLLYILERCGGKPNFSESMFSGLLYFIDFNFYEIYEDQLTGSQYNKLSVGPSSVELPHMLSKMTAQGLLLRIKTEYRGLPQVRYIPLAKSDLMRMSAAEKEVIDRAIDQFSNWSPTALNEYAQKDLPLRASASGKLIDYELVLYREPPFSVRTYDEHLDVL